MSEISPNLGTKHTFFGYCYGVSICREWKFLNVKSVEIEPSNLKANAKKHLYHWQISDVSHL